MSRADSRARFLINGMPADVWRDGDSLLLAWEDPSVWGRARVYACRLIGPDGGVGAIGLVASSRLAGLGHVRLERAQRLLCLLGPAGPMRNPAPPRMTRAS